MSPSHTIPLIIMCSAHNQYLLFMQSFYVFNLRFKHISRRPETDMVYAFYLKHNDLQQIILEYENVNPQKIV